MMGRKLFEDNKGQVSAELIIVIAALLAVAMIFVNNLSTTVEKASTQMEAKSDKIIEKIETMPTT